MRNSLRTLLCCSTLCAGLAATSASASESRVTGFSIPCTGSTQVINFLTTGLGTATSRFVQGTEISITNNPDALRFIFLGANVGSFSTLLTLGVGQRHAFHDYTGFYSLPNVQGTIPFVLFGACSGGGSVDGIAVIQFFS